MTAPPRTLFSVVEVTERDGTKAMQVEWSQDLIPVLDWISPNGELTDRVINFAEELMDEIDSDEE